jgi:hypothetical protein
MNALELKHSTPDDLSDPALRERNEERARQAIERLGKRYLCHPANAPQRVPREAASTVLSRYWGSV